MMDISLPIEKFLFVLYLTNMMGLSVSPVSRLFFAPLSCRNLTRLYYSIICSVEAIFLEMIGFVFLNFLTYVFFGIYLSSTLCAAPFDGFDAVVPRPSNGAFVWQKVLEC